MRDRLDPGSYHADLRYAPPLHAPYGLFCPDLYQEIEVFVFLRRGVQAERASSLRSHPC